MTIDKTIFVKSACKLIMALNGRIKDGIIINGCYMIAMNNDQHDRVKLPSYFPDSFVLPPKLIFEIANNFPEGNITLIRSEKFLEVSNEDKSFVYSFIKGNTPDEDIEEYGDVPDFV